MPVTAADILACANFRHACKAYDPARRISEDDFQTLLQAALLAPSSFGLEPWRLLVIERPALRQHIAQHAWGAGAKATECSHVVAFIVQQEPLLSPASGEPQRIFRERQRVEGQALEQRCKNFERFAKSDFALVGHPRAFYDWACKQSYIAMANMLTAAAWLGIDSTPIEGFELESMNAHLAREVPYNPEHYKLAVMACFGYRLNPPRPKTRRTLEEAVQRVV